MQYFNLLRYKYNYLKPYTKFYVHIINVIFYILKRRRIFNNKNIDIIILYKNDKYNFLLINFCKTKLFHEN